MYNEYDEAKRLAVELDELGLSSVSIEIRNALATGSTGTEIFMRLRAVVGSVLNGAQYLDDEVLNRAKMLYGRLNEALAPPRAKN